MTAPAILQGADLVTIGAQYQTNPFRIISLASEPIRTPQEMIGKRIGVQSANESVWKSFLKANNIDPGEVTDVSVQVDPTPLTTGAVDGWFSFISKESDLLKVKGIDTVTFRLADYNYPLVYETYIVRRSSLASDRDKIKAVLIADIKGWHDCIADPTAGPPLVPTKYGGAVGLTDAEQVLEAKAQSELILTPDTSANGIFTIAPALVHASSRTLAVSGITISADQLFELSVIEEIYQEHPDLKISPTPA
jgi:ABC-type nitrate/sulfonate/bicarbonate transport system substrate-binding protein